MNKSLTVGLIVVAIIAIGAYGFPRSERADVASQVKEEIANQLDKVLGSIPGGTIFQPVELHGGALERHYKATSTTATTYTLVANDIAPNGVLYSTVALTSNVGDLTLTLPASSTLAHVLPQAGMSATQCLYNASTTAGIDLTIAAGTGIDLESATSTLTILSDSAGCFRWTRKPSTSTAFDFLVQFFKTVDAD